MTELEYVERILFHPDPGAREERFRGDPKLRQILPEVLHLEGVPQPPDYHPEGDVLTHTLLAVRHLPDRPDRRLAWAVLLHDVGKALTTRKIGGRIRTFGHDREGADLARGILKHLGMEPAIAEDVLWLIRHHMFALSWQVGKLQELSRRQWRFIADDRFPLLLQLMEIDALAAAANPGKLAQVELFREARGRVAPKE